MHPRNRYSKKKPDFWELAEFRPSLKPFLIKKERGRKSGIHETPPTRTSTCSGTPDAPSTATPNDPLTVTPNAPPTVTPDAPPTVTPDDLVTVHVIPEATPTSTSDAGTASAPSDTAAMERHKYAYTMNFSDVDGTRELTCALLEKDFDLRVEIPVGSLVPTVPQKLNYIHWVEDLLSYGGVACLEEGGASEQQIPRGKDIVGIDIGTGTTCIYPLLGSKLNNWRFVGTDISEEAVECATRNVSVNSLEGHIEVKLVSADAMLKDVVEPSISSYAFSMCNPPFFKSKEERLGGSSDSQRPTPSTVNSGSESETITQGGEVQFVKRMIEDSLVLQNRVRWYTSMLGKRSSLRELHSELKSYQVPVVTTTEFVQGKTWRWGLAWSFDVNLKNKVVKSSRYRKIRQHFSLQVMGKDGHAPCPSPAGVNRVKEWLLEEWNLLEINATVESCDADLAEVTMRCIAERVTWTNQRKIKRLKAKLPHSSYVLPDVDDVAKSALEVEVAKIETEINTLCRPCRMEFAARIKLLGEDARRGRRGGGGRNKDGRQQRFGKGRKEKVGTGEGEGRDEEKEGRSGEESGGEGRSGMAKEGNEGGEGVAQGEDEEKMAEGGEGEVGGEGRKRKHDAVEEGNGGETLGSDSVKRGKISGVEKEEKGEQGGVGGGRRSIGDAEGRKRKLEGEGGDVEGKKRKVADSEEVEQALGNSSAGVKSEMTVGGEELSGWLRHCRQQAGVGKAEKKVCVELEWRGGDQEIDLLHRLLQYLQNKMTSIDFKQ